MQATENWEALYVWLTFWLGLKNESKLYKLLYTVKPGLYL